MNLARLLSPRPLVTMAWFATAAAIGTGLLALPVATAGPGSADLRTAAFSAVAAVCATGLTVVDPGSYWSGFGQAVLLLLMELGALGVMVLACVVGLQVIDRLGLRSRVLAPRGQRRPAGQRGQRGSGGSAVPLGPGGPGGARGAGGSGVGGSGVGGPAEANGAVSGPGGVPGPATIRRVVVGVLRISLIVQVAVWVVVALRLVVAHDEPVGRAVWRGAFLAASAFTNTGLSLWPDSVASFAGDPVLLLALLVAVVLGGIGYPVLHEAARGLAWRRWSVHSRLTLATTGALLVIGPLAIWMTERRNPATLADLPTGSALLSSLFAGVAPRTSGFAVFDYAVAEPATLLITSGLMFVGGGSAGAAGGIKVTTLAVLILAVVAELRGRTDVDVYGRRIAAATVRQALAVVLLALTVLSMAMVALLEIAPERGTTAVFDVVSAFSTSGLWAEGNQQGWVEGPGPPVAGSLADLPLAGQLLLLGLVVLGRFGSLWLVSGLALRRRGQLFRNPQARPLVG